MKNVINSGILAIVAAGLFASCTDRRDDEIVSTEKIAVDSVKVVSDTMFVYTTQSIRTYSTYTQTCQGFYGYDYQRDNLTRMVTAYAFKTNEVCNAINEVHYSQFNFRPEQAGTYTFKFYAGNNTYITKDIVVID